VAIPSTHSFVDHPPLVTALVAVAPTSPTGKLEVAVPAFGFARSLVLGWAPRASLPAVGDECLIAYDERGDPWVVSWVTAAPSAALLAALPASPFDGQAIYFQSASMAEAGVIWHLRYRAASASAHKWEFVGGPPIASEVAAQQGTKATSFVDLATAGPSITAPLAGDYEIGVAMRGINAAADFAVSGLLVGAEPSSWQIVLGGTAATQANVARTARLADLAAAIVVKMQYHSNSGGEAQFMERRLTMTPVRVG
jgi:hypothetical protein